MAFEEVKGNLGFGLMRLPMIGEEIDIKQTCEMADYFLENGFTYFDTAYSYIGGKSEEAVKEVLVKRHPRESFQIATKLPVWELGDDPTKVRSLYETSIQRMGVDYIDYYLLHAVNSDNVKKYNSYGMFDFVRELKKEGKVKNFGLSFHDTAEQLEPILKANPDLDFVQLQINYLDREDKNIQSLLCYDLARKYNLPIIVMEPVKGGMLADLSPEIASVFKALCPDDSISSWAFKYVANVEGVEMSLSGMSNMEQMKDNVKTYKNLKPLSAEEAKAIDTVTDMINAQNKIPCTSCGYCLEDCPQSIKIPSLFGVYNKQLVQGLLDQHKYTYQEHTSDAGKASDCIGCALCEGHCPQKIEIIEQLKAVSKIFD